jgi:hypothetical protein
MAIQDVNSSRLDASFGTATINDTTEVTVNFDAIQINEATVINKLEINGVDVLANYVSTPATALQPQTITCPVGKHSFSKIKLTSGSVTISYTQNQPYTNIVDGVNNVVDGYNNVIL